MWGPNPTLILQFLIAVNILTPQLSASPQHQLSHFYPYLTMGRGYNHAVLMDPYGQLYPASMSNILQPQQPQQPQPQMKIENNEECESAGISCSGHSKQSCQSYCHSVGFPLGTCQGSCCLCTHAMINFGSIDRSNQFLKEKSNSINIINNQLNLNNKQEDLDTAESRFNPLFNQNNIFQQKNKNTDKPLKGFYDKEHSLGRNKNSNKGSQDPSHGVCQSDKCVIAAKQLQTAMNLDADPCTNFYEYACGGFLKTARIPRDETEVTRFSTLRNKVTKQLNALFEEPLGNQEPKPFTLAKTLYSACMHTELIEQKGVEPLKSVLEMLGGWAVVEGNRWQPQFFTWSNFLAWFRELGFNHNVFLKIGVDPDIKNVQKRVITIGEPELGLSREVLIKGMSDSNVQAYYKYMVNSAMLFGASRFQAESEMLKALTFEIQLAKSFYREPNSRASTYYVPSTIAELEKQYQTVPWLDLLQRIFPDARLNYNEVVVVTAPHFIKAFVPLVESTDIRTVSNYAIWRAISSSMSYLNEQARKLQFQFSASVTGQRQRVPRWKECTNIVASSMGNAAGAMYIRRYFDHNSKAEAESMIGNIHKAFFTVLDDIAWMDTATKRKAKEKAQAMNIFVGYPQEHLTDGLITQLYSGYSFDAGDYMGNIRNLVVAATDMAFGKLRMPINKNDWVTRGKTAVVNAFYLPLDNSIQIPAGILQSPFFDSERPRYMNYGAIGWVTGHEVTHGFDDQGHQFDKNGNHQNWWDPFTKRTYTTKTQCIINQYGRFSPAGSNLKLNGVTNQGENIADNGGIKQAYLGYLSWVRKNGEEKTLPGFETFSPRQLFWISAANNWCSVYRSESLKTQIQSGVHSPGEFRVRGTFANNVDFARDFKCPVGSLMNPSQKCDIW